MRMCTAHTQHCNFSPRALHAFRYKYEQNGCVENVGDKRSKKKYQDFFDKTNFVCFVPLICCMTTFSPPACFFREIVLHLLHAIGYRYA